MNDGDFTELIVARLETMPSNVRVNLGNLKTLGRDDLITHVKKGDSLGQQIIEMQMAYLKSLKDL
jgi:hypothetical protein